MAFLILLTTFFQKNFTFACLFNFYWISPNKKVRFAQVLASSKVAKIEGDVFVALRDSQGDLEPSGASISPQSPSSLTPEKVNILVLFCFSIWASMQLSKIREEERQQKPTRKTSQRAHWAYSLRTTKEMHFYNKWNHEIS